MSQSGSVTIPPPSTRDVDQMDVDQLAGLPDEQELEREIAQASGEPEQKPESKPQLPSRFTRKSTGWK